MGDEQEPNLPGRPMPVLSVLIVDDEPEMREYIRRGLTDPEARRRLTVRVAVHEAADGREAVRLIEQRPIDFVISDVEMPRMDGLALARELRERRGIESVPLLLISAEMTPEEASDAGASGLLPKPFSSRELLERVGELLHGTRQ